MEIHEIRYFLAVSETLNFTRAAEHCNVTQPSLTRAIKSLEDKLSAGPLINRERGKTHLTELGRMMKPYLEEAFRQLQQAKAKAHSFIKLEDASLSVGVMTTIGPTLLIDFFTQFRRRYPGIIVNLVDGSVDALEAQLDGGGLDLAIYCRPEQLGDRFHALALFRERFMVLLPPKHELATRDVVRMRDLDQQSYLGRKNCEYYDHLREVRLRLGGIEFKRPYTSDRDDWVQAMVIAGVGFTYIPEFAVTLQGLAVRPLVDPAVARTVQLVTVRGRPHSLAVGAFVREARRYPWLGKVAASEGPQPLSASASA